MQARTRTLFLAPSLTLVMALSACESGARPVQPLAPVTVQLRWTHQSQFAGFYVADQKGYYAAERLRMTFLEGGPSVDLRKPVLANAA